MSARRRRRAQGAHRHAHGVQRLREARPAAEPRALSKEELIGVAFEGDASDPATMAALLSATSLLVTTVMEGIMSVQEICGPGSIDAAWEGLDHEFDVAALRAGLMALAGRIDALGDAILEQERREGA
jgi:hypothetical protein